MSPEFEPPLVHTTSKEVTATTNANYITEWTSAFYKAKKVEGVSPYTLTFYRQQLGHFLAFCARQDITRLDQLTPDGVRDYLLWLAERHNPGGQHAAYRVLKTFLRFYDSEAEPEGWRNP